MRLNFSSGTLSDVPTHHGADMASTWVAKPEVHAENENSRKTDSLNINANEENFDRELIAA